MKKSTIVTMEELKEKGIADFYGDIDGKKLKKLFEEEEKKGNTVVIEGDRLKGADLLDGEQESYFTE